MASLYAGMATLYRSRITDGDGSRSVYAELIVRAAGSALAGLPADSARSQGCSSGAPTVCAS
ncbi:MAG: hypothetical protein R2851_22335 [Caldilineaceae bacterium]